MAETVTKLVTGPERIQISFQLGERTVDSAVIKPLMFAAFSGFVTEAHNLSQPKTFEARMRRIRLSKQVVYYAGNVPVPVTQEDVAKMPIPIARKLAEKLDGDVSAGKLTRTGDGIDTSVVFTLATPINTGGKGMVSELEFQASTYGDVEDVLAAPNHVVQTLLLLSMVAKPLGTSLSRLPDGMVNQVTASDGFAIASEVLPLFLGSADES